MTGLKVGPLDAASTSPETVCEIASLVNTVYVTAEASLWHPSWVRTSVAEISALIAAKEIIAAYDGPALVGVVHLHYKIGFQGQEVGEFGMLAVPPELRGTGAGRVLVQYVEAAVKEKGVPIMQLEILVPKNPKLPIKEFLLKWYDRMGYRKVGDGDLNAEFVPLLERECDYFVFQKVL